MENLDESIAQKWKEATTDRPSRPAETEDQRRKRHRTESRETVDYFRWVLSKMSFKK